MAGKCRFTGRWIALVRNPLGHTDSPRGPHIHPFRHTITLAAERPIKGVLAPDKSASPGEWPAHNQELLGACRNCRGENLAGAGEKLTT
jgi:hypothetical protein